MQLRLLRLFLGFAAFAWGVSVVGVFVSWSEASNLLQGLGAKPIAYDPMLDYWLRMAAGAFTLVGCWYLVLMIWPRKFHAAIPWFGVLMIEVHDNPEEALSDGAQSLMPDKFQELMASCKRVANAVDREF